MKTLSPVKLGSLVLDNGDQIQTLFNETTRFLVVSYVTEEGAHEIFSKMLEKEVLPTITLFGDWT